MSDKQPLHADPNAIEGVFKSEMPTECGSYECRCDESEYEVYPVTVFRRFGYDGLLVDDPGIGTNPIEYYHDNLLNLEWRKL